MSKTPSKTKQKLTKKSAPRAKPKVIKTIQSWFEKDGNVMDMIEITDETK